MCPVTASQIGTVDVGHALERAEVDGKICNGAGRSELLKLAQSDPLVVLPETLPREVISHLDTKPGKLGYGVAAEGFTAFGVGPTLKTSQLNALCAMKLTRRYDSTYRSRSTNLQDFAADTGQPTGVLEKVACCLQRGPIVGELVVRVCRGREIPALPWGREDLTGFEGLRRPAGKEPERQVSGPTLEIRQLMEEAEQRFMEVSGPPVVVGSEVKVSSGESGRIERHGSRTTDSKASICRNHETDDSSTGQERWKYSTAHQPRLVVSKSGSVQREEGGVGVVANVVVQEVSSQQSPAFERNKRRSGVCTRTHLPQKEREKVESEFGEQFVRHYQMIWAAMEGCVTCVKAYQEAGGSKIGDQTIDVWSGTCKNVKFNAWRASYVSTSLENILDKERLREYLLTLDGSKERIEWTKDPCYWRDFKSTESMAAGLLETAEAARQTEVRKSATGNT